MTEYNVSSLADTLKKSGESVVRELLSSFVSPLNKDVENFLKNASIDFAKKNISPTTLVYAEDSAGWHLCGYFTLTIKTIDIEVNSVSSTLFKKVNRFGVYDKEKQKCTLPVPLIAQLGKNYANNCSKLIKGSELLKLACDEVRKAQYIIGGKAVYLECEDIPKLIDFYRKNGFREFSQRKIDDDEKCNFGKHYLVQMLKYLN